MEFIITVGTILTFIMDIVLIPAMLIWFLMKVRPRISSLLVVVITGVIAFFIICSFLPILEMLISDPTTLGGSLAVGIIKEGTTKIILILIGIKIFADDIKWLRDKLGRAFFVRLMFGIIEMIVYSPNTTIDLLFLFLAKIAHPFWALAMFEGYSSFKLGENLLAPSCS